MTTTISNYEQQAIDFLQSTSTTFTAKYLKSGTYFDGDKEVRDIYEIELKRGERAYKFTFGQSINESGFYYQYKTGKTKFPIDRKYLNNPPKQISLKGMIKMKDHSFVPQLDIIHYPIAPTAYDVLASLTKNDPCTFEDFCSEFGYDTDSEKAEKTYQAVVKEYQMVCALFTDAEIEQLQEIN